MLHSEEDSRYSSFYNTQYKAHLRSFYFGFHRWTSADLTTELLLTITSHESPNHDRLHTSDQILHPPYKYIIKNYTCLQRFSSGE